MNREFEIYDQPSLEFELDGVVDGGTNDHDKLINRDKADQHPIEAITGLKERLLEVYDNLIKLESMTVSAETLPQGSQATVTKTVSEEGIINFNFGIPKGDKGDNYVITEDDYEAIANLAADILETRPLYPRG